MSIQNQVMEEMKAAMKAKDKVKLEALRAAKSAFLLAKTEKGGSDEISEEQELKIIQKLVKQRKDSAAIYKEQGREDLLEKEVAEMEVLEQFLPAKLTPEELETVVKDIITKVGASSMADMGKVMGMATKELAGKADGKDISNVVRKILAG